MARPPTGPLVVSFDASLRSVNDDTTPTSAAVGCVVTDGSETVATRSIAVDTFVSSSTLELRALVEAARTVSTIGTAVGAVHVNGDADAAVHAADPDHPSTPSTRLARRRVRTIRSCFAAIPVVTYRVVPRRENVRAHELAKAGHSRHRC
ncbi:reverse transcriptase-like protein [Haloarcula sp. GH36]|uniref:reverse transcriptase-like protein n=1 Tax=Haloarcula montana TaxID=3111776 RepID=UPI002D79E72C|nr:reverse transcriptase-like protein [Haloarcula sp. GH36]